LRVERTRKGTTEYASVTVSDYPYPTQRLSVPQKMVDPPEDQLDRIRRENRRVRGLWYLGGPPAYQLPLHPPLDPLPNARSFGSRRVFNGQPGNPHSGADFSADTGTPVLAAAGGVVTIAEDHYFAGNSVFIDHGDDLITMYFHLDRIDVEEGQTVLRGEAIGTVGATGRVTGPHLHFGIRWHGARVDPSVLFEKPDSIPVID
jgi:murein DD-endopeptidase MepM/ murein hydrolase activator NlpD